LIHQKAQDRQHPFGNFRVAQQHPQGRHLSGKDLVHLCANLFKIGANSLEIRDGGGYLSVVEAAYPNDRPGAARAGVFV
jgi:hypothetical protein